MKKLVAFAAGTLAAGSMALITAGQAASTGPVDVSGQTYGQAVALLQQQGYQAVFGGSVGSDVPQSQCIVESQKLLPGWPSARVSLMLNCTKAAQPPPGSQQVPGKPGPPTVGGNGITTVTATPVGPQPGMNVPGM
ncbi:hypothetical protein [Mycobacterium sp.]|uniref:hypothetical protein n=1 Tax=Mycobacterium sp. TaxID=1785 RepID=UPI002D14AFFD|nr:hypothetical protein [Mycobacterium sp.]HME47539.1 hypothetical protein [Mycobacterium sp.]